MKNLGRAVVGPSGPQFVRRALPFLALAALLILSPLAVGVAARASATGGASSLRTDGEIRTSSDSNLNASGFMPTYTLGNSAGFKTTLEESQDTPSTAFSIPLSSPIWLNSTWTCAPGTPYSVGKIVAQYIDLNVIVATIPLDTETALPTGTGSTCGSTPESYNFSATDFSGWQYVVSGTWGGNVYIYNASGGVLGEVDFMMNIVPPLPITILTLPLILLVVYEVYSIFSHYRHMPRKPKEPKVPDSATNPPPPASAPTAGTPPPGPSSPPTTPSPPGTGGR